MAGPWLVGALAAAVASALEGLGGPGVLMVGAIVIAAVVSRHPVIALVATLSFISTTVSSHEPVPMPAGHVVFRGPTVSAVVEGPYGPWVLVESGQGPVLVELGDELPARGAVVGIEGMSNGEPGVARGIEFRSVVKATGVTVEEGPTGVLLAGHLIRSRVLTELEPYDTGRALLAGFLIGDTSHLDEVDIDAMRRAGLSHFTAVSGSNVALFLVLVYVATGPLSLGPRRRAVIGLAVLPVYAAATGFEPSVLRASAMAATMLIGRLVGFTLDAWQVLATAVAGLIIVEPDILASAGFQLSVAATAGVMIGSRWPTGSSVMARPLAVTVGAQLAVAPLLLVYFGTIPILAPVVNLVAAPVVAFATLVGSLGVAGLGFLIPLAADAAGAVMFMAHTVSGWPQIGVTGFAMALVAMVLLWRLPAQRGAVAVALAISLALAGVSGFARAPDDSVVVFDVGQGDGILISGGGGHYALVDGGPDPVVLLEKLRSYGIGRLELVVLTHLHSDHIGGMTGPLGRIPVERVWADPVLHATDESDELFAGIDRWGIAVTTPIVGDSMRIGGLLLTVLGPERRYAASNDQSIVLLVQGVRRTMLLSGDIETAAQADLGEVHADILKVPHHGGGTSDAHWLESVGAEVAVISVGVNDFGHPAPWVLSLFAGLGTEVLRTDRDGDVAFALD